MSYQVVIVDYCARHLDPLTISTMFIGITHNGGRRALRWSFALLAALLLVTAACGGEDDDAAAGEAPAGDNAPTGTLRLGYFPNVTHAPAIIGVQDDLFAAALGPDVELQLSTYNSGTEAVEALSTGSIDATFIGPNPAINGYAASLGDPDKGVLRIVAGTTSGGAALVVDPGISSPADLAGTTLATPSLGNTQDVALRAWLKDEGFETDPTGGGDVKIVPQDNADTLTTFQEGTIQGAWVPEPWATRLVREGGGKVLVDEADLWPDGQFVTTHLVVRTEYLAEHPANVRALISGLLDAIDEASGNPEAAQEATNAGIEAITTKRLPAETIAGAWKNLTFTPDPIASSLEKSKDDAVGVGLLDDVDLDGIYDLSILNELLAERGEPEVHGL
jgi:sulfonate transport system substrate-binding protein